MKRIISLSLDVRVVEFINRYAAQRGLSRSAALNEFIYLHGWEIEQEVERPHPAMIARFEIQTHGQEE